MTRTYTNPDGTTVQLPDGVRILGTPHIGLNARFPESSTAVIYGGLFFDGLFFGGLFFGGAFHGGVFYGGVFRGGSFYGGVFRGGPFHDSAINDGEFHSGVFHNADIRHRRDVVTAGRVGNEPTLLTAYRGNKEWMVNGGCAEPVPLGEFGDPFTDIYPPRDSAAAQERIAAIEFLRTVVAIRTNGGSNEPEGRGGQ